MCNTEPILLVRSTGTIMARFDTCEILVQGALGFDACEILVQCVLVDYLSITTPCIRETVTVVTACGDGQ